MYSKAGREMIWQMRSRARQIFIRVASSHDKPAKAIDPSNRESPFLQPDASITSAGQAQILPHTTVQDMPVTHCRADFFYQMKQRFLTFKKHKYLTERERYQMLSQVQLPKCMVIACADSRVCPSNILGFEPGEAFMVRNIANIVPPIQNGPTETNAALEFAVTNLTVRHIFVIGHSSCAGIQALMRMEDDKKSSSIEKWVANAKMAKLRTMDCGIDVSFDERCRMCEKESIKLSLQNLLTYPWIEEQVRNGLLSIHGGYYNFLNCTFEKWTLDLNTCNDVETCFSVKDKDHWC